MSNCNFCERYVLLLRITSEAHRERQFEAIIEIVRKMCDCRYNGYNRQCEAPLQLGNLHLGLFFSFISKNVHVRFTGNLLRESAILGRLTGWLH